MNALVFVVLLGVGQTYMLIDGIEGTSSSAVSSVAMESTKAMEMEAPRVFNMMRTMLVASAADEYAKATLARIAGGGSALPPAPATWSLPDDPNNEAWRAPPHPNDIEEVVYYPKPTKEMYKSYEKMSHDEWLDGGLESEENGYAVDYVDENGHTWMKHAPPEEKSEKQKTQGNQRYSGQPQMRAMGQQTQPNRPCKNCRR